jgi:hypothetical protein
MFEERRRNHTAQCDRDTRALPAVSTRARAAFLIGRQMSPPGLLAGRSGSRGRLEVRRNCRAGHLYGRTIEGLIDGLLSCLPARRLRPLSHPRVREGDNRSARARGCQADGCRACEQPHDTLALRLQRPRFLTSQGANKAVLREQAVADCEGFGTGETHMTKQE